MVSEALFQNIGWHMWLYYLPPLADRMERNLQPGASVDMQREWPTPYHYLLYSLAGLLIEWIGDTRFVPEGQENIVLESTAFWHENENIPKSSILALSEVLGTILMSQKVGLKFQAYILDMSLGLVEDLRKHGLNDYARLTVEAIARGSMTRPTREYRDRLLLVLTQCDVALRNSIGDEALRRTDELLGEQ
jgi:hypothetical protein